MPSSTIKRRQIKNITPPREAGGTSVDEHAVEFIIALVVGLLTRAVVGAQPIKSTSCVGTGGSGGLCGWKKDDPVILAGETAINLSTNPFALHLFRRSGSRNFCRRCSSYFDCFLRRKRVRSVSLLALQEHCGDNSNKENTPHPPRFYSPSTFSWQEWCRIQHIFSSKLCVIQTSTGTCARNARTFRHVLTESNTPKRLAIIQPIEITRINFQKFPVVLFHYLREGQHSAE